MFSKHNFSNFIGICHFFHITDNEKKSWKKKKSEELFFLMYFHGINEFVHI